nr:MAG TPA: hypothetical protein [Caudoviricetes sp.]
MDWISGNRKKREEVYKILQNANVFYRMADIREKGWRVCAENIDNMECAMAFPIRYFTCIQRVFCKVYSLLNDKKPQKENKSLTFVGEVIVDIGVIIKKLIDQLNCNSEIKDLSKKFQKLKVSDFSSFNHEILKDSRSIKVINLWGKNLKKLYYSWADFEEYMNLFTINVNLQINQIGDARSIDVAKKHYGAIANFVQKYGWIYRDEFKKKTLKNQRIFDISFKAVEVNNVQYCSIKNIQLGPKIHLDFPSDMTVESMIENLNLIKNLEGERYSREFKSSVSKAISNIEKLRRQQEQPQQFEQQPQQPEKSHEEQFEVKSSESELLIAETSKVENTNGLDKLNENHRLTPEKSKDELSAPELGTETKSNDTNPEEKAHDSEQEPQDDQLNDEISRDAKDVCDFSKDALDYLEDIRDEIKPVLDGLQAERYEISCDAIDENFIDALNDLYNKAWDAYDEAWKVLKPLRGIYEDNEENVSTKARECYDNAEGLFGNAEERLNKFKKEQNDKFSEAIEKKIENFRVAISSLRTDLNKARNFSQTSDDEALKILEKAQDNVTDIFQKFIKFINIVNIIYKFVGSLEKKYREVIIPGLKKQILSISEEIGIEMRNVQGAITPPEGVKEVTPPDSPTETQPVIETYDDLNNQIITNLNKVRDLLNNVFNHLNNVYNRIKPVLRGLQAEGYEISCDAIDKDFIDALNDLYNNAVDGYNEASDAMKLSGEMYKDNREKVSTNVRALFCSLGKALGNISKEFDNFDGEQSTKFSEAIEKKIRNFEVAISNLRTDLNKAKNAFEISDDKSLGILVKAQNNGIDMSQKLSKFESIVVIMYDFLDLEEKYREVIIPGLKKQISSILNEVKKEICNVQEAITLPKGMTEVTPPDSPTETQPVIETYGLDQKIQKKIKNVNTYLYECKGCIEYIYVLVSGIVKGLLQDNGYEISCDVDDDLVNTINERYNSALHFQRDAKNEMESIEKNKDKVNIETLKAYSAAASCYSEILCRLHDIPENKLMVCLSQAIEDKLNAIYKVIRGETAAPEGTEKPLSASTKLDENKIFEILDKISKIILVEKVLRQGESNCVYTTEAVDTLKEDLRERGERIFNDIYGDLRQLCKQLEEAVRDISVESVKTVISCNSKIESKLKEMRHLLEELRTIHDEKVNFIFTIMEDNETQMIESITVLQRRIVKSISEVLAENELASQKVNFNIAKLAVKVEEAFGQVNSAKVSKCHSKALEYQHQIEKFLSESEDIYNKVSYLGSVPEFSNDCNRWNTELEKIRSVKETVEKEVKGIEEYVEKTKKAGEIIKELEEIEQRVTEESRNLGTATIDETVEELTQQLKEKPSLEKCLETLRGKTRNVGNFMQNWNNELVKISKLECEYNKVVNDAIESTNEKINEEMEKAKLLIGGFNVLRMMIEKKIKKPLTDPSSDDDYDDYDDSGNSGDSGDSGSSEEASEYSASTDEEDIDEPSEDDLDNETTDEE